MEENITFPIKKTPVILVIIFDFLTGGIYSCAWFLVRIKGFNRVAGSASFSPKRFGKGIFILCLILLVVSFFLGMSNNVLAIFPALFVGIILLIQCFRAKEILEFHLRSKKKSEISLSGVATFFFRIYYLQYSINKIHGKTTKPTAQTQKQQNRKVAPCNAVQNYDQLIKLKNLHKEGILSEEEYLAEKNKLI